jgi:hypothetical protein
MAAIISASFNLNTTASLFRNGLIRLPYHAHQAEMKIASVAAQDITLMPLSVSPKHFAEIMETLIGRSYGWAIP